MQAQIAMNWFALLVLLNQTIDWLFHTSLWKLNCLCELCIKRNWL